MAKRNQYPLRIDPAVWEAVERWAADILRRALKDAGRLKGPAGGEAGSDAGGEGADAADSAGGQE